MSGVNRVQYQPVRQEQRQFEPVDTRFRVQDHCHTHRSEHKHESKHADCDGHGKKKDHCHDDHNKKLQAIIEALIAQAQAAMQRTTAEQISQANQRNNEPTPAELDRSPAKIDKLIHEAKLTRGVDQGQALRELDALTGAQATTNALLRAIV